MRIAVSHRISGRLSCGGAEYRLRLGTGISFIRRCPADGSLLQQRRACIYLRISGTDISESPFALVAMDDSYDECHCSWISFTRRHIQQLPIAPGQESDPLRRSGQKCPGHSPGMQLGYSFSYDSGISSRVVFGLYSPCNSNYAHRFSGTGQRMSVTAKTPLRWTEIHFERRDAWIWRCVRLFANTIHLRFYFFKAIYSRKTPAGVPQFSAFLSDPVLFSIRGQNPHIPLFRWRNVDRNYTYISDSPKF